MSLISMWIISSILYVVLYIIGLILNLQYNLIGKKATFKRVLSDLNEGKWVFIIGLLVPIVQQIYILFIIQTIYQIIKDRRNEYEEMNNIHECYKCGMYSREYQQIHDSKLNLSNNCPFCKSENSLKYVNGSDKLDLSDLMLAKELGERDLIKYLTEVREKWAFLEKKQEELEKMRKSYLIKRRQVDNYMILTDKKTDALILEYEEKMNQLQEDYDKFSSILEDHLKEK